MNLLSNRETKEAIYLVTGGCGFIGSHLVDLLIAKGYRVRVLDDLSNSTKKYLHSDAEFIYGSLNDEHALTQALEGVGHIFHLAAMVSVPESMARWHQSHLVNCGGTIHLLERAKGIPIVFASSAAVYGNLPTLTHSENALTNPLSPYAIDKLTCEWHAKIAWQLYGTPSIACRFFNVYGPRQNPSSPYSGVISKFADCLVKRTPLNIFGDGNQSRDFIYVKDVVRMLDEAMGSLTKGAHVYNFCTGIAYTINELASQMMRISDIELTTNFMPARQGDCFSSLGDPTKAIRERGLKAKIPLEIGIKLLMQEILPEVIVN